MAKKKKLASVTPLKPLTSSLPSNLDEMDLVKTQMLCERQARIAAQLEATEGHIMRLRSELVICANEMEKMNIDMRTKYSLDPADKVSVKTGQITRGRK